MIAAFLVLGATLYPAPKHSLEALVSSNGYGTLQYSLAGKRFDRLLQHPYKHESHNVATRDLLFDAYFGVAHAGGRGWLPDGETLEAGYVPGTGIIAVRQSVAATTVTTYAFTPRALAGLGFVLIAKLENTGSGALEAPALYAIVNQRLGGDRPEPQSTGESIQYNLVHGGFVEYGPFGSSAAAGVGKALGGATRRSSGGAGSPTNPWPLLQAGAALSDAIDDAGSTGQYTADDIAFGYQWQWPTLAGGESVWAAVAVSYDHGNIAEDAWGRLEDWLDGIDDPEMVLMREISGWNDVAAIALPAEMSDSERALYRQSVVFLKMAQVKESGRPRGQILASLAASTSAEWDQWNITWVRDMAYATVALAEAGQWREAREALEFQLRAQVGRFTAPEFVGRPYQISLCRYFGDGSEESDDNENGPNVEYDGFGLFLWSLGRYVELSHDTALLEAYWPTIRDRVADVLVALVEPYSGLVRADSSIWETHWNGRQRQFAYTSLVGVSGLCAAGALAQEMGEVERAREYRNVARQMRQAIIDRLSDESGVIASSVEERNAGKDYYDAAVVEAVAMRLLDPAGREATATLDAVFDKLAIGEGRGLFRNDEGGDYDRQEWVFVNLRAVVASLAAGRAQDLERADRLYAWVVAQSAENADVIAELYDRSLEGAAAHTYRGSVPMIGFGAGAYLLAANAKYGLRTQTTACGSYDNALERALEVPDVAPAPTQTETGPVSQRPSEVKTPAGCGASPFGGSALPWLAGGYLLYWLLLRDRRRVR